MNRPLVSIIIPTYNRLELIYETLDSVINQTYKSWECIIVDDGSNQEFKTLLNAYISNDKRISFFERQRAPKGVSTSRNIGVTKALGEFIMFLDSDDVLDVNCLKNRVRVSQLNQNNDFWVFKMQEFVNEIGDNNQLHNKFPEQLSKESFLKSFVSGIVCFHLTSVLWKRESFLGLNGFDESLTLWEDPDLHVDAISNDLNFYCDINGNVDSFFRVNRSNKEKLFLQEDYVDRFCEMLFKFQSKILNLYLSRVPQKNIYKKELNKFILTYFEKLILAKKNFKFFLKYLREYKRNGLISFKQDIILYFLFSYHYFAFNKLRVLILARGYNKLKRKFVSLN